jgi:hypothetical protein
VLDGPLTTERNVMSDTDRQIGHDDQEPQLAVAGMDDETADSMLREIERREARGLPGVGGYDWADD